ncbi:MAG: helix-turn-helix domain-containing protein [Planctomycetes bacterium]|nr:helix-turn-helix domain-containing protein [Planctomycetota bacterium]
MKFADGRTLLVEIPGRWVTTDRDGAPLFSPDAVRFLDRIRALAGGSLAQAPSPGYLVALREGLGQTQTEFGEAVGVTKLTVSRWERGTLRPGPGPLVEIEKLRKTAIRRGVVIPG